MRPAVKALAELGRMPDEDVSVEVVASYERHARQLDAPATDAEADALLDVLPQDDNTFFGLAWAVLHFIESAPTWPHLDELDDRGWWVKVLRERAERSGRSPAP